MKEKIAMKGIAISQIILLVLGIIVLGVVAFLLISNFTTTTGQIDIQKCRTVAINACTSCAIANGGNAVNCDAQQYITNPSDRLCAQLIGLSPTSPQYAADGSTVISYDLSGQYISCSQFVGGRANLGNSAGNTCTTPGESGGPCTQVGGSEGTLICNDNKVFECGPKI